MKSKRRHELQTNELADRLGHVIERIRPFTTLIMLVVLGIVIILAAGYYLSARQTAKQGQAWQFFMDAGTDPQRDISDQFAEVSDDFSGTTAGLWAAQTAGDLELARGIRNLFIDRAMADTSLTQARRHFREVLDSSESAKYPMLLRRARFALAQTHEALGELDDAKKLYAQVVNDAADNAVGAAAKQRIERLDEPKTESFYNWFTRQKPVPPAATGGTSSPLDDLLGSPGAGLDDLPDSPGDFTTSDFGSSTSGEPSSTQEGGTDEGKKESAPPTSDATSPPAKDGGSAPDGGQKTDGTVVPPDEPGKS